jgi:hypothetical protein
MNIEQMVKRFTRGALVIAAALAIQIIAEAQLVAQELTLDHPRVQNVIAVQKTMTPELMKVPGVLGTAAGLDASGAPALVIYVDQDSPSRAEIIRGLPPQIRGVSLKVELTEKFRAFAAHTAKQTPPIQLGTSGGWSRDLANGYCCGGTLGSLVQVNGVQYVMSNYHVFESDIVSGGNNIVANTGDPIIQPGLIDVSCNSANAQSVCSLVKLSSLPASNVDVSVAQVSSDMVKTNGAILEIGTISRNTVAASLRQAVKKSGRTTGLSSSTISGLNATVSVAYDNECAGGSAFTKTFTGQIVISNKGSKFLNAGDSGSLMVENVTTNPRAVGLLYAGSSTSAIANPINEVLQFIGAKLGGTASMVGN